METDNSSSTEGQQAGNSALPPEHVLDERYLLIELLEQSEEYEVYKAEHLLMRRLVKITVWKAGCAPRGRGLWREAEGHGEEGSAKQAITMSIIDAGKTSDGRDYLVIDYTPADMVSGQGVMERAALRESVSVSAGKHKTREFPKWCDWKLLALMPILVVMLGIGVGRWLLETDSGADICSNAAIMLSNDELSLRLGRCLLSRRKYNAAGRLYGSILQKGTLAPLQQMDVLIQKVICDKGTSAYPAAKEDEREMEIIAHRLEKNSWASKDYSTFEATQQRLLQFSELTKGAASRQYYEACFKLAGLYGISRNVEKQIYYLDHARTSLQRWREMGGFKNMSSSDVDLLEFRLKELTRAEAEQLESLKRYNEAEPLYRSLLQAADGSKQNLTARGKWLARVVVILELQHKFDDAAAVLRDEIALERKVSGDASEYPLWLMCRLAVVLSERQKYEEADKEYIKVIALLEQNKMTISKELDARLSDLESLFATLPRNDAVVESMKKRLLLSDNDPDVSKASYARLLEKLALTEQANPEKAAEYWLRAAEAYKRMDPPLLEGVIRAASAVARYRAVPGRYDDAIGYARQVIELTAGNASPAIKAYRIQAFMLLAECYVGKKEYRKAVETLKELIGFMEQQGMKDRSYAEVLTSQACNYFALGQTQEACLQGMRSADAYTKAGGCDDKAVVTLSLVSQWYKTAGKLTEAERALKQALGLCEKGGNALPHKKAVLVALSSLELSLGKKDLAQEYASLASLIK